jgi:hypothetical protein
MQSTLNVLQKNNLCSLSDLIVNDHELAIFW